METLASYLESTVFSRPVRDKTRVTGEFDFDLNWAPDETQLGGRFKREPQGDSPDLFTALSQQLGLKLQRAKIPIDVIVVDHAEPPSEN